MVDRLQGALTSGIGASQILEQQIQQADLAHLDVKGALPPALAPLATADVHRAIGSAQRSDNLRLSDPGRLTSTPRVQAHIRSMVARSQNLGDVPLAFQAKIQDMTKVLMQVSTWNKQIGGQLGKSNA